MDWLGFLGSIISGIIGGLFTFLGVKVTVKNDDKKRKKEELDEVVEKSHVLKLLIIKVLILKKTKMIIALR